MSNNLNEQVSKTVESAKDTMEKFGEQVTDFFQGNPFSTPVGKKIGQFLSFFGILKNTARWWPC